MAEVKKFDTLEGMLVYVQVQEAVKAYSKPPAPPKPNEWKASIVIADEDYLDEFEAYVSSIDAGTSIKKVKTAEFEGIYKCKPPEGAGKNVWVVTFRKSTELGKTGKLVPDMYRPRVYQKKGGTLVDITATHLVGNASLGKISVERFDRDNGTASLYLKNVLVTNLVEYVKPEGTGYEPGSEFGDTPAKAPSKPTEAPKAAAGAKVAAKAKVVVEDDDGSDAPF